MEIRVAKDGSGDYTTVQAAIDAVSKMNDLPITINIGAGIYKEVIHISKEKPFITLKGQGADQTIITYDNYAGKLNAAGEKLGTNNSATVFIDASDFRAEGITFENSYYLEGLDSPGRQAVAVNTIGQRNSFKKCSFKGYQDTLYVRSGSCYFIECYIEGDIDFIFGGAHAVFEGCQIHSLYGGSKVENGFVTAPSTSAHHAYGFLFESCHLTADSMMPEGTVYLGRPWHPSKREAPVWSSCVFKNCILDAHIHKEGWTFMGEVQPETERLYEFENRGPGAAHNSHRRQLTKLEVEKHAAAVILV